MPSDTLVQEGLSGSEGGPPAPSMIAKLTDQNIKMDYMNMDHTQRKNGQNASDA